MQGVCSMELARPDVEESDGLVEEDITFKRFSRVEYFAIISKLREPIFDQNCYMIRQHKICNAGLSQSSLIV